MKKLAKPKTKIGWKEWFSLDCLGLPAINAKIDTGAKTSSLHAFNIENFYIEGVEYVKFFIHPLQKNKKLVRSCVAQVFDRRMVSDSGGKKEKRYVIKSDLRIGEITARIEFTLANRDSMAFRMLLGRQAIKQMRMLVDVSKSFVQGKRTSKSNLKLYRATSQNLDPRNSWKPFYWLQTQNFIPINMRLGGGLKVDIDEYNTFGVYLDFNKLLVPSPPVYKYKLDSAGNKTTEILLDGATGEKLIEKGKNPNVDVVTGMLQSFSDAPFGFKEEMQEININTGFEYCYNNILSARTGYFYESIKKGGRQYFTIGIGMKLKVITIDGSYLIPTSLRNPLQNTWRISLSFYFDKAKGDEKEPAQP